MINQPFIMAHSINVGEPIGLFKPGRILLRLQFVLYLARKYTININIWK